MKEFIADKPQRLKEYTDNTYAQGSFFWNYLIKDREIRVNGKKVGEDILLSTGDKGRLLCRRGEKTCFYISFSKNDSRLRRQGKRRVNSESGVCGFEAGEMFLSTSSG